MFSKILKSAARKNILELLLKNSRQKYYLRELAALIQYSPGSLQRELNSLVDDGLLIAEKMGNLRFFSLNTKSPFMRELRDYLESHQKSDKIPAAVTHQKPNPKKQKQSLPTQPTIQPTTRPPTPFSSISLPAFSKPVLSKPHLEKPILTPPPTHQPGPTPLSSNQQPQNNSDTSSAGDNVEIHID